MGCCCDSVPARLPCPRCGHEAGRVERHTLLHQLRHPWRQALDAAHYYFCATPGCEVVYFDAAGSAFGSDVMRQPVGQKRRGEDDLLCYCFDIRYGDATADDGEHRRFVIEQTRQGLCACDSRNPSGHCCLRDFPDDMA